MPIDIGPRIGIDGQAEFSKSIANISSKVKALAADMNAVTSAFDRNDTSQKKLQSQIRILSEQVSQQQKVVDLLGQRYRESANDVAKMSEQLKETITKEGAASDAAIKLAGDLDRAQQSTNRAQAAYNNAVTTLNKMGRELSEVSSAAATSSSPLNTLTNRIKAQETELNNLKEAYANIVIAGGKSAKGTKEIETRIKELNEQIKGQKIILSEATGAMDKYGDEIQDTSNKALSFGDVLGGSFAGNLLSDVVSGIGGQLSELASDAITASDSLTKFESTMDFAGFDSATIDATKDAMQEYASRTVYDLETVSNTVAQLGANGVADFEQLTEAAGNLNAVAGGNSDTFQSVAQVLTQTAGAGKLTSENWNQLTDAIPGASGVIQQALLDMGAYTGNFREAMEDGEISAEEFNAAIMELGNQDAAVQAATSVDTVEGAVGNLKETITGAITEFLGNGGSDAITTAINKITDAFQWIIDHHEEVGAALIVIASGFAAMKLAQVASNIGAVITNTATLSQTFPLLSKAISVITNPFFLVGVAIAAVILLIVKFGDQIQETLGKVNEFLTGVFAKDWTEVFGDTLGSVLNGFFDIVQGVWTMISGVLSGIIDFVKGIFSRDWERAWRGVSGIFESIWNGLKQIARAPINAIIWLINKAIGAINWIIDGINSISFDMPDWLGGGHIGFNIGRIPEVAYLAKGGILKSGSAVVGEAGPELLTMLPGRTVVQPLPRRYAIPGTNGDMNRQPVSITVNVYAAEGQDENAIANIVMEKIQSATTRKGAVWG